MGAQMRPVRLNMIFLMLVLGLGLAALVTASSSPARDNLDLTTNQEAICAGSTACPVTPLDERTSVRLGHVSPIEVQVANDWPLIPSGVLTCAALHATLDAEGFADRVFRPPRT